MRSWLQNALRGTDVTTHGRPADRLDFTLAGFLAGLVILEIIVATPDLVAFEIVTASIALLLLPFRRQIPVEAAVIAFGAAFIANIVATVLGESGETTFGHIVAGFLLIYALCRWPSPQLVALGMSITMGFVLIGRFVDGEVWWQDLLYVIPWFVLGCFALAMRYRATLNEQHDQQVRLTERNALARELHDSVAHHVSAIAVQAQAAQFVAMTDPGAAADAMGTVEEIANNTIDEMRYLVGILRTESDRARTVSPHTLSELADPTGVPRVSIVGGSDLSLLSASVAAAVYRIAQESITNARRHSNNVSFVDVNLTIETEKLTLEVVNDGTPTSRHRGGGYGLVGMNERVALLNGTINVGPRPTSGWEVTATIPLALPA